MLADVLPIKIMYGRCFAMVSQMLWSLDYVDRCCVGMADGIVTVVLTESHPIYVVDGTSQCFCQGMDY